MKILSTALSVNVNKVALVRNTRHLGIPSVTPRRRAVPAGGRPRHHGAPAARRPPHPPDDVFELHAALKKDWPTAEFNIEGNPFHNLMDFVRAAAAPHQCTFVPDSEGQFTSDHGWNLRSDAERVRPLIAEAKALGVRVSLFMDPTRSDGRWPRPWAPTASSSTPSPMPGAWGTPCKSSSLERFARPRRPPRPRAWASTPATT
jgi:pyridoxine 5-phosphate synthase